jgi:acyl carrier protein
MKATLADIRRLVADELRLREVPEKALIIEELGAESIDVMNIVAAIEERYGVTIGESELSDLRTPAALFERIRGDDSSAAG